MLRRILSAAFAAGILGGLAISAVQELTTTPLILFAEQFEVRAAASAGAGHIHAIPVHDGEPRTEQAWAPADGFERLAMTAMSNVLVGVGYALVLTGCFALHGARVDGRRGVLWGLAGFAAFTLAPSLGLPPELPGTFAAELSARQGWWFFAAGATAFGLWLMVFGRRPLVAAAGVAVLLLPHIVGAPHPGDLGGAVPPELAGQFAAAAIVVSAVFWSMLGWLTGTFYRRFA